MHDHYRKLRLLLTPSLSSGTFSLAISGVFIGRMAWEYITNGQLFYEYLFGAYGLHTYFWQNTPQITGQSRALLDSSLAYHIVLIGVALLVGLLVFVLLQGISIVMRGGKELVHTVEYIEPDKRRAVLGALLSRLGLRVAVLAGWVVYGIFFLATLVPYVVLLTQEAADHIQASRVSGWLLGALALAVLSLGLHVHIVFARLCLLRSRVF